MQPQALFNHHSYAFASRLQRALQERIYVVGCEPDQSLFNVQGTSEMTYDVVLLPLPSCTCMDFTHNNGRSGAPCKHIINVVVRVLQLGSDVLDWPFNPAYYRAQVTDAIFVHRRRLVDNAWEPPPTWPPHLLQSMITNVADGLITHRRHLVVDIRDEPPPVVVVTPKLDESCVVCYDDFKTGVTSADCWTCRQCGHRLHDECWRRWKRQSHTCPFCRFNPI